MEYLKLVDIYEKLGSTSKRLEKTHIISEFLKKIKDDEIEQVMLLLEGRTFPSYDSREIGVAARLMLKALSNATGISIEKIEEEWKKLGDLGLVAESIVKKKKQFTLHSTTLTIKKVFDNIRKLAELEGSGTVERKVGLISELLTSAQPLESKYIVKTIVGQMRIGVGEGSMRDAIVWAFFGDEIGIKYTTDGNEIEIKDREKFNFYVAAVQNSYDLTNEFAEVVVAAKKGLNHLQKMTMKPGIPISVMLSIKAENIDEAFETVGKPAAVEFKYDGFRIQAHKDEKGKIRLFTRRLEDVTHQFPDVVEAVKSVKAKTFIIDSEAVGFSPKTGKYLPFQSISQRIKRKYEIERMVLEYPVELNVFDVIFYDGKSMISEKFSERRKLIEKIIKPVPKKIVLSRFTTSSDATEIEKIFTEAFEAGNEGLMFKALDAPYKPGARVGHMMKYKHLMETLDLVIVGAEWGEGKRSKWLSSYILACIDNDKNLLEIGRASTGLKEKREEGLSFEEMTEILKPLVVEDKGKIVSVKPKIVIEVGYEEIQQSPSYASGYALRFPRVVKIRDDKGVKDASNIDYVKQLFEGQKKR